MERVISTWGTGNYDESGRISKYREQINSGAYATYYAYDLDGLPTPACTITAAWRG